MVNRRLLTAATWVCSQSTVYVTRGNGTDSSPSTVEPGYNDIGLYDTSPIALDILWYQLIPPR